VTAFREETPMKNRLSAERIAAAMESIEPAFLHTPQWLDPALSAWLGCDLVVKDESAGPLGCFKGRGTDLFVAGAVGPLVCASAGNFGLGLADAGRRRGVAVTVYVAAGASPIKIARILETGARVVEVAGDFDDAKEEARAHAARARACFVEDGAEIAVAEGAGTIAAELDALPVDDVVVPVGNGALIAGIGTWMRARHPATRVVAVCSAGATVMRDAWRGVAVDRAASDTIADGIAVRVPVPAAVADLACVVDEFVAVDDEQLLAAMRGLHASTGIAAEPSAVAGLAAIAAAPGRFGGRRVATVVTGKNLTRQQRAAWLSLD
jgi:threonine dehydratase